LPTRLEGADVETVLAAAARDKKRRDGAVRFVLLEQPGEPRVGVRVGDADLDAAVRELT
jgi:3-dehydroquinate synthetase